jgi:hypothetical protein
MQYILEPEVSGEIGERTVIDSSVHPPIVSYLHFVFMGWLGDDLIELPLKTFSTVSNRAFAKLFFNFDI